MTDTAKRPQRRRKDGDTETMGLRLPIPDEVYEKYPSTQYRHYWFRDEPGRIKRKYSQDWDVVEGIEPIPGAMDRNGRLVDHILCVKLKEFDQQDKDKAEQRRKGIEAQMERGVVAGDASGSSLGKQYQYEEATQGNRLS